MINILSFIDSCLIRTEECTCSNSELPQLWPYPATEACQIMMLILLGLNEAQNYARFVFLPKSRGD